MNKQKYLEYCKLLNTITVPSWISDQEKEATLKPLIEWIHKHIPTKLYKFRKCNENNINAFRNQQIWFGTGSQMNDDFDARLYCDKVWLSNAWKSQIADDGKLKVIAEYQKLGTIPPYI